MKLLGIIGSSTSATGYVAPLYSDSFTNKTIAAVPHIGWNQEQAANPSTDLTISSTVARLGSTSLRVELNYASQYNGSWRSELRTGSNSSVNAWEHWFGFSNYFPSAYVFDSLREVVFQLHDTSDEGDISKSPSVSLETESDYFFCETHFSSDFIQTASNIDNRIFPLCPITKDVWNDWVFYVKLSYNYDGIIKIWRNNVLLADWRGPNTYNDALPPYHKIGIYKSGWDGVTTTQRIYYVDQYSVGNSTASYNSVHVTNDSEPTTSLSSSETCVLRETFPNNYTTTKFAKNIGWLMVYNATAITGSSSTTFEAGVSTLPSLNVGYNNTITTGYLYSNQTSDFRFHYTDKVLNVDRTSRELTRIKFNTAHGGTGWNNHLCVKVAGNWYLYDRATLNTHGTNSGTGSAGDAAAWATFQQNVNQVVDLNKFRLITFVIDSTFSIGGSDITLPSGNITGIGLYAEKTASSNRLRFDDIELYTTAI